VSFSGEEESWEQVKERLLSRVSELAEEALERNDPIEGIFVSEVEKSVHLLDLFIVDYDIVVSNPPYLNSAKIDASLKSHISDNYLGNRDLYTSFIERNTELVHEEGLISMITLQGFMYLASFEDIREMVVHENSILEFVHSTELKIGSEDTSMFVLENKPADSESVFVDCTDADEKQKALDESFNTRRNSEFNNSTYIIDQNSIKQIRRTPIVYHFGDEILTLFEKLPYLSDVSNITSGLATGDNDHHLRKFWEVPEQQIGQKYQWQIDNGDYNDFYDQIEYTVRWINDGENIKEYAKEHGKNYQGITNDQPYFEEGVIFRNFSKIFTAKLMPGDCIYNKSVYHIRPSESLSNRSLLAYLNSNLYRYVAHGINPTVNFNPGDAGAVFAKSEFDNESKLRDLAQECIDARKQQMMFEETAREFSTDIFAGYNNISEFVVENLYHKDQLSAEIALAKSHINNLIFDEFEISEKKRAELCNKYHPDITDYPNVYDGETYEISEEEYESICRKISENIDVDIQVLSEDLEVNPHSIAEIRRDSNSYAQHKKEMMVQNLLSYFLGCMLGRWENNIISGKSDGVLVFDEGFKNNVNTGLRKCMKETFSDIHNTELEIEKILGNGAKAWLRERFFRYHHCKEYRRRGQRIPIYWQLESDGGAFSCFVYYHKMDADTLHKLRGQYIDKKLDTLQNRLEAIESELEAADGDHARELRSDKEEVQADIDDITEFRNRVDTLIDEGFEPDFEAGIWENIQKVDEHDLLAVSLDKL
jgi:hypothetical protein